MTTLTRTSDFDLECVGFTDGGAPDSGSFRPGQFVLGADGIYVCYDGGTPGSWFRLGSETETYAAAGSHQTYAADLEVDNAAGRDVADGTSFIAPFMGNVIGGAHAKTGVYLAGLIGLFSVMSTTSHYPAAGVIAGIADGVDDTGVNAVTAFLDGDSALTRGGAFFGVKNQNSTPGSGMQFGVDLQSASHDGFDPIDKDYYLLAVVRLVNDVCLLVGAGAPVDGTTGDEVAGPGSVYIDITGANWYVNGNTKASPTWKLVTRAA